MNENVPPAIKPLMIRRPSSILSIRVIARAREAGLQLTPKEFFEHQTIAELASNLTILDDMPTHLADVEGAVPLLPIQHAILIQIHPKETLENLPIIDFVPRQFAVIIFVPLRYRRSPGQK